MSEDSFNEDEPLAPGLPGIPVIPAALPVFRRAVLEKTTETLRGVRRRWRWMTVAGLCAAYAAGFATMGLWPGGPGLETPAPAGPVAPVADSKDLSGNAEAADPDSLLAKVIGAPRDEQIRLLKETGNAYLARQGDIVNALYYYRQALELIPASRPITVEPNDTWLWVSLNESRMKEGNHENTRS